MLDKARQYAVEKHSRQKYGDKPYVVHLDAVVKHLENYGETAQVIGYLHDVIEDTDASYEDIKENFGTFIADCVSILTDEPGQNRRQRKKATYQKMSAIQGDLELALTVKAADRLANIQACIRSGKTDLLNTYLQEHSDFERSVYRKNMCEDLWKNIRNAVHSESQD